MDLRMCRHGVPFEFGKCEFCKEPDEEHALIAELRANCQKRTEENDRMRAEQGKLIAEMATLQRLVDAFSAGSERLADELGKSNYERDQLIAEVERLTAGIQKALDNPGARAYILEHTLKNGAGGCCEGRCQGHSVPEAVKP